MQLYETTVVIDSMLKPDDVRGLKDRIANFISNNGGEVLRIEEWGKRRLAYEIQKKQYGLYLYMRFSSPPAIPALLEKEYRLNEAILRFLTVKVDPRALKKEEHDRQKAQRPDSAATEELAPLVAQEGAETDEFVESEEGFKM